MVPMAPIFVNVPSSNVFIISVANAIATHKTELFYTP
jgi:hypothetical protein